ncbi:hypothetical protein MarbSA_19230 [Methanobrevibacter arboriphilus]|uniref:Uncharacterized protein n=1 Tax=Methanobrevibacter arboriphilus TaxID=39441 RepID=A0ACA8R650_METAZ|nr:hypothetical protein MarbSA_19230 [Methanobrevibacter arboriphilus]
MVESAALVSLTHTPIKKTMSKAKAIILYLFEIIFLEMPKIVIPPKIMKKPIQQ